MDDQSTEIERLKECIEEQDKLIIGVLERLALLEGKITTNITKGTITMNKYKKCILVTGDTHPIKNTLSENSGKWNRSLNGWVFTKSHIDEVIDAIRETGVELVVGNIK